jgi:hypothetical protein
MLARNKSALKSFAAWQGRAMKWCQRSTPVLLLAVFVVPSTASIAQVTAPGAGAQVVTLRVQTAEELRKAKERGVIGCAVELIVERGEIEWTAADGVTRRRFGAGRHCLDERGLATAAAGGGGTPPPPPGNTAPPCQSQAGRAC